jgi:hypothetical protein
MIGLPYMLHPASRCGVRADEERPDVEFALQTDRKIEAESSAVPISAYFRCVAHPSVDGAYR